MTRYLNLLFLFPLLSTSLVLPCTAVSDAKVAPKPLYRDPVYDGAADPVVIWNPHEAAWWMFYTNRRANVEGLSGVAWVHGSHIGIAESRDGGSTWTHVGTANIDVSAVNPDDGLTFWAPDVYTAPDGSHYMFLTLVPGVFETWDYPRSMVRLESEDLRNWSNATEIVLSSDRVIDAAILQLGPKHWRMWYNDERDGKSIYYADSEDLQHWTDRGKAVGDQAGEGPKVFRWKGYYWMVVDVWDGLGVYRSDDATTWLRQPENLLREPGVGEDDRVKGGHPDVVVREDRAWLFYFVHPGRTADQTHFSDGTELRRSSIQVVELQHEEGQLHCDRNAPTYVELGQSE
ncbi:MAG: family 43 glycosylhydrolase [Puniceicoccaceae bacterium]